MFEKLKKVRIGILNQVWVVACSGWIELKSHNTLPSPPSITPQFKDEMGHARVPKGYEKDPELANWVRNQRLEEANQKKGNKSRMTKDRFNKLDALDFRWSNPTPSRSKNKDKKKAEEESVVKDEEPAVKAETGTGDEPGDGVEI